MTKKNTYTLPIAISTLALFCFFVGYYAGNANTNTKLVQRDEIWTAKLEEAHDAQERSRNSYEADIEGLSRMRKSLLDENTQLKDDIAKLEGSNFENHSDWLDCCASLKFIDEHLGEIDHIDTTNPVPVIYMKDNRTMCANESHEIVECCIPEPPIAPVPPPTPSTTAPSFMPNSAEVVSISYASE